MALCDFIFIATPEEGEREMQISRMTQRLQLKTDDSKRYGIRVWLIVVLEREIIASNASNCE